MNATQPIYRFQDEPRDEIRGVTFRAANYCVPCGVTAYLRHVGLEGHGLSYIAQEALDLLGRFNVGQAWRDGDEYQWDSDDFPKVILRFQDGIGDHCDECGREIR